MSRHVWLSARFAPTTLRLAADAFRKAVAGGLSYDDACRWAGYVIESTRQKAYWVPVKAPQPSFFMERPATPAQCLEVLWSAAVNSGHRYARGRNRENYRLAGGRLVGAAAEKFGFVAGTHPNMIYDYLAEFGHAPADGGR
jgi:hypothetical protein